MIQESAKTYQDIQNKAFEMIALTNKNLFRIVEQIAEKEIEKNPIEFIRKESFAVGANNEDAFFSFEENEKKIMEEDEEDEDNEYHSSEHAVDKKYMLYNVNKHNENGSGEEEEKL